MGRKAQLKTKPTTRSVAAFLAQLPAERRAECEVIAGIMRRATAAEPVMWGPSIVGFGRYNYKYGSGREGEWMITGFSPRVQNLTLYLMDGVRRRPALLDRLGKYTTGVSCLYIKRLSDVDLHVLTELVQASVNHVGSGALGAS